MKRVYLDNASTSFPKPPAVIRAISDYLKNIGASPGRGSHQPAIEASRFVYRTRQNLSRLFNLSDSSRLVFTANATESLNLALKGILKKGDRVITTSLEHQAVTRPLKRLGEDLGIRVIKIRAPAGKLKIEDMAKAITSKTRMVVMLAASNVTGGILPIAEVGEICRKRKVLFLVDAAQAAGHIALNISQLNVDLLAFTGHKALLGPMGIGGLYIREGVEVKPLKEGGTASAAGERQPLILPDRYESGTMNMPGIVGLGAGIEFILDKGMAVIREKEMKLLVQLTEGLKKVKGIILYGPENLPEKVPLVSFNLLRLNSQEVGYMLDKRYNIAVRTGLHCAPWTHRSLGTEARGTVRVSLSFFNTSEEIIYFLKAVTEISRSHA